MRNRIEHNEEFRLKDLEGYMRFFYYKIYKQLKNIENMNMKDFKIFCLKTEKNWNFLWTNQDLGKEVIRKFFIEKLSSKEKFYYLKHLLFYIWNKELEKEILTILIKNSPNKEETISLMRMWESNIYRVVCEEKIIRILSGTYEKDSED